MNEPSQNLPPLEWVRAFEAAARLGSFTAAAVETGLTQPAISQRIGQLEKHLGAQLFLRQARTITLTVEGEAWLPHVQAALRVLTDSSEMLFSSGRNRLTISASQSVISMWLAPRLARANAAAKASIHVQSYILGGQTAVNETTIQIRYGAGNCATSLSGPFVQGKPRARLRARSGNPRLDAPAAHCLHWPTAGLGQVHAVVQPAFNPNTPDSDRHDARRSSRGQICSRRGARLFASLRRDAVEW